MSDFLFNLSIAILGLEKTFWVMSFGFFCR